MTQKDECANSGGKWVPDGDCNDPTFCPKVTGMMVVAWNLQCVACAALLCTARDVHLHPLSQIKLYYYYFLLLFQTHN
jgi:hypothetical protein